MKKKLISMLVELSENYTNEYKGPLKLLFDFIKIYKWKRQFCYKMINYCVIYKNKIIKYYLSNQYTNSLNEFTLDLEKIDLFFFFFINSFLEFLQFYQ